MVSPRKRIEQPPVTAAPTAVAEPPPKAAADDVKPLEIDTQSPADAAASSAIKMRLAEMERATSTTYQTAQQPPQYAQEPQPQAPQVPEAVQKWMEAHPEYLDPRDVIA